MDPSVPNSGGDLEAVRRELGRLRSTDLEVSSASSEDQLYKQRILDRAQALLEAEESGRRAEPVERIEPGRNPHVKDRWDCETVLSKHCLAV